MMGRKEKSTLQCVVGFLCLSLLLLFLLYLFYYISIIYYFFIDYYYINIVFLHLLPLTLYILYYIMFFLLLAIFIIFITCSSSLSLSLSFVVVSSRALLVQFRPSPSHDSLATVRANNKGKRIYLCTFHTSLSDEHHRKRKLDATVAAWEKRRKVERREEEGPKGVDA